MADDILKTLIAEAYGEGPEAMRLVAETILNRSAIRGLTPEQVVRQRAQYTGLSKPGSEAKKAWSNPEALAAAQAAWELAQQPGDPTGGADHYYAPGTISQPYWAKGMKPTVEAGGHKFFASRPIPPGELPEVATALATVPTPRKAPAPVTPSIDMAQMRRISAPSQLIPDTFSGLNKPRRTLGDELAMSPVAGGQQQAPMFDGVYDERIGAVRPSGSPIDTQGMGTVRSREPAPVPRMPSPQLAGRRATDPALQAALNARNPAQLPPLPAPSPIRTASDRVRGNPMQTMEQATTVASIPTRPQVSASDLARGRSGISTVATIPTTGFPTTEQIVGGTGFRPPPAIPERLTAGILPPALYGGGVAGVGTRGVAPVPFARPQTFPTQFAQAPRIAPVPFQRPTGVGTALSVRPMPPMPIARPSFGMGGGERPAPVPASMSPMLAMRRALPVLRPPTSPAARREWMSGFSDSSSSGGAHGGKSD
jgi:hypothetical protein